MEIETQILAFFSITGTFILAAGIFAIHHAIKLRKLEKEMEKQERNFDGLK